MQFLSKGKYGRNSRTCGVFPVIGIHVVGRNIVTKNLSKCVEPCDLFLFSKQGKGIIVVKSYGEQEGMEMDFTGEMERLKRENAKLKEDNEMLLSIIAQMRVTLNRLVNRYIEEQPEC